METYNRIVVKNIYVYMDKYWKRTYMQMMKLAPSAHTIEGIITWLTTEGRSDCADDVQEFIEYVERYMKEHDNDLEYEIDPMYYFEKEM